MSARGDRSRGTCADLVPHADVITTQAPRRLRVVSERCGTSSPIRTTPEEPLAPPARRVDQREAPARGGGQQLTADHSAHVERSHRERCAKRVGVDAAGQVDLVAREGDEPRKHTTRSPAELACKTGRRSLIPPKLPFDGAEVVDAGLHFNDEQRAGPRIEREEIDPTVATAMDELDFPVDFPVRTPETPAGVTGTPGVDQVVL